MVITADHLCAIVLEFLSRHRLSPYELESPRVVAELILEEYDITAVSPSRFTFDELCREILPSFPSHFVRMSPVDPNVGRSWGAVHAESRDDYLRARAGVAPPDPNAELLVAVSMFRSNPVAALAFINGVSRGQNRSDAIRDAKLAAAIADLFLLNRSGMVATSRAVSSNTGLRRDIDGPPTPVRDARGPRRPVPPPLSPQDLRRRLAEEVSRDRARHGARLRDIRN